MRSEIACNKIWDFQSSKIMTGGITQKAQPLDVMINKIWTGFFHDIFEEWSLNSPTNSKTGNPVAPSCQLLAQWVVVAWEKPHALVKKAWVVCGYQSQEELTKETGGNTSIVSYSSQELGSIIEKVAGEDAAMHFLYDPENESGVRTFVSRRGGHHGDSGWGWERRTG